MEKTKLVRTFGAALATATLSFGLFAAPALAVDATVGTATVEIKGEAKAGNEAKAGDTVEIEIPVSVSDVDAIQSGVMTFKVSNGGVGQELTLGLRKKDNNTLAFDKNDAYKNYDGQFVFVGETDNNGQMKINKIYAKVAVNTDFMNGTWKLDSIKLYNDTVQNDDTEIADIKADATFKVSGNSHEQSFALDLETLMTKKTVYHGKANSLVASLKPANDGNNIYLRKAEVVYVNPAGEEQKYTVSPINGVQFTVNNLNTQVDGIYELKSIKLYDGASQQLQSLVDTVVYEDLGILDDGDYEVTLTGVEAMIRLNGMGGRVCVPRGWHWDVSSSHEHRLSFWPRGHHGGYVVRKPVTRTIHPADGHGSELLDAVVGVDVLAGVGVVQSDHGLDVGLGREVVAAGQVDVVVSDGGGGGDV